jgi:hypothetical protein
VSGKPGTGQKAFVAYMQRSTDTNRLHNLLINSTIEVFTTDELSALADFYGSPIGKSILQKFPKFMGTVMPTIQQELMGQAQRYKP